MAESQNVTVGVPDGSPNDAALAVPSPFAGEARYDNLLRAARASLVPERSSAIYEKYFQDFELWMKDIGKSITETDGMTLTAYLQDRSSKWAASTLWSRVSGIKKCLLAKHGLKVDTELSNAFMKRQSAKHRPKQAATFSSDDLKRVFVSMAESDAFLCHRLAILLQLHGGLRLEEATNILVGDLVRTDRYIEVNVRKSKTDPMGDGFKFLAVAFPSEPTMCPVVVLDRYLSLIPDPSPSSRLFRQLHNGKYTRQCLGRSFFQHLGCVAASKIALPDAGLQFIV